MISAAEQLSKLCERIQASPWVAIDTEADSLHAYPAKVCLIQIGTEGSDDLVDPLAGLDLKPLFEALQNRELILHGSDYDLRMLSKTYGFAPNLLFDTMIAARYLGEARFGLGDLAERFLGVKLEKGPQTMDWALRPLTPRMATYARNDTHHLQPLSALLKGQLAAKGRHEWVEQACAQLVVDCTQKEESNRDEAWRLKGSERLSPRAKAILREIFGWREQEAIRCNRPPYFVLRHESALEISESVAEGRPFNQLIPVRFSSTRRRGLTEAVERGVEVPEAELPQSKPKTGRRPTMAEVGRFDQIKASRDAQAAALEIDPSLIASKYNLMQLAQDWELGAAGLLPWQLGLLKRP